MGGYDKAKNLGNWEGWIIMRKSFIFYVTTLNWRQLRQSSGRVLLPLSSLDKDE